MYHPFFHIITVGEIGFAVFNENRGGFNFLFSNQNLDYGVSVRIGRGGVGSRLEQNFRNMKNRVAKLKNKKIL